MSLYGADVSNHQGGHHLGPFVDAGHRYVILKATEGATYRDRFMAGWRAEAHAAGMFVGLYHFNRDNDPAEEVANFLEHTGGLGDNEFAVADWEANENAATSEQCQAWLEGVEAATGRRPVLYSYAPYLEARPTANLTRWPLWIAAYGPNDGAEHPPPRTDRWTPFCDDEGNALGPGTPPFEGRTIMWQFTSNGSVEGWDGRLDLNRFDGTEADLAALCGSSAPAPAPTPPPAPLGREVTFGWREIHSYAAWKLGPKAAYPTPGQSYAGSHAAYSWHKVPAANGELGCAVDYGDANSDPQAVFDLFRPLAVPGGPVPELIFEHIIIKEGVESYYAPNDHGDHCHVAIRPAAHLPFDTIAPPASVDVTKEDPVFLFGLPDNGGIWLAWAGKRWYINAMGQVEEMRRLGVPFLDNWPEGASIPVGNEA